MAAEFKASTEWLALVRLKASAEFIDTNVNALSAVQEMRSYIALRCADNVADLAIRRRYGDRI